MGFIWAVTLAQSATTNIIKPVYQMTEPVRREANIKTKLTFFNQCSSLFNLTSGTALALAIIYDVGIIYADWNNTDIVTMHSELVRILIDAGLPIVDDKSIKVGDIKENALPFIGNIFRLLLRGTNTQKAEQT